MENSESFCYLYDGTFEGLLTCIYEAYYKKQVPARIICTKNFQESLLEQNIHITADMEKARRVCNSIKEKISPLSLKKVYYTYLSDYEDSGIWIYEYLRLGWRMGGKIDEYYSDERVLRVHKTSLKVFGECHRILGLLRFQEIYANIFYAKIEPDHNIIAVIAPHFANRFSGQNWIIHDVKRNLSAVYDKNDIVIKSTDFKGNLSRSNDEARFQRMWKTYFESIAIKNRVNPRLQKRFMPVRYWKHLVEMQHDFSLD